MDKNNPRSRRKTIKVVDKTGDEQEIEKRPVEKKTDEEEKKVSTERKEEIKKEGLDVSQEQKAYDGIALSDAERDLLRKSEEDKKIREAAARKMVAIERAELEDLAKKEAEIKREKEELQEKKRIEQLKKDDKEQREAFLEHERLQREEKMKEISKEKEKEIKDKENELKEKEKEIKDKENELKDKDLKRKEGNEMKDKDTKRNEDEKEGNEMKDIDSKIKEENDKIDENNLKKEENTKDIERQKNDQENITDRNDQEKMHNEQQMEEKSKINPNSEKTPDKVNNQENIGILNAKNDNDDKNLYGVNSKKIPMDDNLSSKKEKMLEELNDSDKNKIGAIKNNANDPEKEKQVKFDEGKNEEKFVSPKSGNEPSQHQKVLEELKEKNKPDENEKNYTKEAIAGVAGGAAIAGAAGIAVKNKNEEEAQKDEITNDNKNINENKNMNENDNKNMSEKLNDENEKLNDENKNEDNKNLEDENKQIIDKDVEKKGENSESGMNANSDRLNPECQIAKARSAGNIVHAGDIYKKRSFFACCWHSRYFVLTNDGILRYYKDKNKDGKGNINIVHVRDLARMDEIGKSYPYKIMLRYQDKEDFLGFDSEETRDLWASKLGEVRRSLL